MFANRRRYGILALITLVLAFSSGDRATLSVAGPHMSKSLGIDAVGMGWLFSAFAWAYVLAHVPAGWLVDKLGAKRTVLYGLVLWSITTMLMGGASWMVNPFITLLVLRAMLGTFESPVGPASGRVIAAWFPSSERGMAGAIFNSAQYVSLVLFTPLMGWLDHRFGWEHIFSVMGLLGLVLAVVWRTRYFSPGTDPKLQPAEREHLRAGDALLDLDAHLAGGKGRQTAQAAHGASLAEFAQLFKSRMLVGIFIGQYCISSITWFFVSWFPSYLVQGRGFSILQAGFLAAVPATFGFIGGVSTGFFSDWLLKRTGSLTIARKTPITAGLLLTAAIIGCNYVGADWMVIALMSLAFFGKGFGSLGWTIVADTAPKPMIGLTGGVFNALGNTAGIVTPVVIGYLVGAAKNFENALLYVGLHGLVAIAAYWLVVGRIERMQLQPVAGGVVTRPAAHA